MSELSQAVARFRAARNDREASVFRALRDAYQTAIASLTRDLNQMTEWLSEEQAAGRELPAWRILQADRTRRLLAQAEYAFDQYAREVGTTISFEQRAAVARAQSDAQQLILSSLPAGVVPAMIALPHQAIEQFVATLQPQSPVLALLEEFGGKSVEAVKAALLEGVATGKHPTVVARMIRNALGGQYTRALLITRTETLRAYRGAQMEVYRANTHLLRGWRWQAHLGRRTCPVCLALDGRIFRVAEPMRPHPACRCSIVPVAKPWRDLGFDVAESKHVIETGAEWFARQPAAIQRQILGPMAHDAYANGDVELEDFVRLRRSPLWGSSYVRGSLEGARERAQARKRHAA